MKKWCSNFVIEIMGTRFFTGNMPSVVVNLGPERAQAQACVGLGLGQSPWA
jgi:hypothetical protein